MNMKPAMGLSVLAMILAGCASPPKGENNGRVEVTDTTPAEKSDRGVQLTAQHEFSDQVAQQLALDLSKIPEVTGEGFRSTIVFGDIVNHTGGAVPTTEFEGFRTRIRGKLMQSQNVLKNVRFVENRARLEDLRKRELGNGGGDILQEGSAPAAPRLNPKYTFFLNGEMTRATRGSREEVNEYLMSYTLMSAQDGTLVWQSNPYEVKQVR